MPRPAALPVTPEVATAGPSMRVSRARVLGAGDTVVCDTCEIARTFWPRLRGLMGRRALQPGCGLLLRPTGSVHTCFMRFPIDVVVLDRDLRVLRVVPEVRPWRAVGARRGKAVLELAAGEAARRGLTIGDRLSLEASEESGV